MTNPYYLASGQPATGAFAASAPMRSEFQDVQAGFDKMPALVAGTAVVVNGAGTALSNTVGTLALAGNFATTGAFGTTLVQQGTVALTLPAVSGTLVTLAGTEILSNKTLVAPALGTPASGIATNLTGTANGLTAGNVVLANLSGTAPGLMAGNVTTNANLTGPITSSGNTTAVASQTGTGSKFVMDTSPSLITPNIGDATASSINGNTIAAGSDIVVLLTASQTLTNKTLVAASLGSSTATTQAANNNSTRVATTAYLDTKLGVANGIATLDGSGTLTSAQIPASLLGATVYKGVWNATTNSPVLVSSAGIAGNYYIVNVAGTTTLDGISSWNVGDTAIFSGTVWNKITSTAGVTSVAGKTGAVTLAASDLTNGTSGTGAVVLANSPTLVTPALGIATATSLAIGGASLGSDALAITGSMSISSGIAFASNNLLLSWGNNVFLTGLGAATLQIGGANSASPTSQLLTFQSVTTGTSNTAGADAMIIGSRSTGTGAGGRIILQTSPAGSSGSARNNATNALIIDTDQSVTAVGNLASTAGRVILGANAQINGATLNTVKLRNAADSADAALFAGATTLSAALTYGGVTLSNSVTGTQKMVLSDAPTFTGVPLAPTAAAGNNSTQIATTAYVDRASNLLQIVNTTAGSGSAGNFTGTYDTANGAAPTVAGGVALTPLATSITPKSASSTLKLTLTVMGTPGGADGFMFAIFNGSTLVGCFGEFFSSALGILFTQTWTVYLASPGTSAQSLTVRVGANSGTPFLLNTMNNGAGGTPWLGSASSLVIEELLPRG